jgi:hypothetical protein
MIRIGNKIYSFDLFEEQFVCDLAKCRGACCVMGDSGAPLEKGEPEILDDIFPVIKPFLRPEAATYIEKVGKYVTDSDNEIVTPLLNGKECAYTVFENGIAQCGIEKAYQSGITHFRKPLSCHLYPVRVSKYKNFDALNYHRWAICKPATEKGKELQVPVFQFCKDALVRSNGQEAFDELEIAYNQLNSRRK